MKDTTRRPDFGLYKIEGMTVQAVQIHGWNSHWRVILPDGTEVFLSEFIFDDMATKVDDADDC